MFGSIVQWFYEDLAGIRAIEPGYRLFEVRPGVPVRGLDRVAASYDSVRGRIVSHWRRSPGGLDLDVVIPPNARARVYVPSRSADAVREVSSGRAVPAGAAEGVTLLRIDNGNVVYEVGSGRYQFRRRE
jgi:alpha-L-rhamnosidase